MASRRCRSPSIFSLRNLFFSSLWLAGLIRASQQAQVAIQTASWRADPADGWSPNVTPAPYVPPRFKANGIFARQTSIASPASVYTPCGYYGGESSSYFGCPTTEACALLQPINAIGCCGNSGCVGFTSCVDFSALGSCDSDCLSDIHVLKCTNSQLPGCLTVSFQGFGTPAPPGIFCSLYAAGFEAFTTSPGSPAVTIETVFIPVSSTTLTSASGSTNTAGPTNTAGVNPGVTSSTSTPAPAPSSSDNTGAIVGGVVGGVGGLLALNVLGFFIWRWRHKKADRDAKGNYTNPNANGEGGISVALHDKAYYHGGPQPGYGTSTPGEANTEYRGSGAYFPTPRYEADGEEIPNATEMMGNEIRSPIAIGEEKPRMRERHELP